MEILALDVATNTGVCQGQVRGTPILQSLDWRRDDSEDIPSLCGRATLWMAERMRDRRPDLVAIEQPIAPAAMAGRTNNQTTMVLLTLYGVFCGIVRAKQIPLLVVPIATWRKYALGRGNMKTKEAKAAALELCRRLKWQAPDHNAAEAAGIFLWACSQADPRMAQRPEPLFSRESA